MYKYSSIADSIRQEILEGRLKPGEKLQSIHSYVKASGYNSDTIIKAYQLLEEEHLIYSVPRSGYYVVKTLSKKENTKGVIDLNTVRPPDCINPYKDFYHCMEKSIEIYKNRLLEYANPQGMEELRSALVKHLMNFHIFTKQQDIYITNGAQQALYILAVMPFPGNARRVVVEQPTYSVMLQTLLCNNIPILGVRRSKEGIDLAELEAAFQSGDIKFFYTMSRFQNPTGYTYTKEQKQEIIKLADRYGVYIVEDDYLADLELSEKADTFYEIGSRERRIYIRSFSKTLLPGIRLGMTILPEVLKEEFLRCKKNIDINTPVLTQGALEIYLKSSMYKSHVLRTKEFYKHKMDVIREASRLTASNTTEFEIPPTGIYALIETERNTAEKVVRSLETNKVLVQSIKCCYLEGYPAYEGIRLCVCNCSDEELTKAVKLIHEYILKYYR